MIFQVSTLCFLQAPSILLLLLLLPLLSVSTSPVFEFYSFWVPSTGSQLFPTLFYFIFLTKKIVGMLRPPVYKSKKKRKICGFLDCVWKEVIRFEKSYTIYYRLFGTRLILCLSLPSCVRQSLGNIIFIVYEVRGYQIMLSFSYHRNHEQQLSNGRGWQL